MNARPIPESLRRAVSADLAPVRPLRPLWMRAAAVAAVCVLLLGVGLAGLKLRGDLRELPMWLGWGGALLQLTVGVLLAGLALREAVPGRAIPSGAVLAAVGFGLSFQLAVGVLTWLASPGPVFTWAGSAAGVACMRHDIAFALPAVALTLWLVFRALPLRPAVAGLLAGAGTGIAADAIGHLLCPMSDLRHVVVWHSGAILVVALAGSLAGLLLGRVFGRS